MSVVDAHDILDVREAAEIAQRDPETIRRWVRSGRLAARRRGNRLVMARVDVERLAGSAASRQTLSLSEWRAQVLRARAGVDVQVGTTAADLVLEDRARH